jgi:hypothetical protein
LGRVAAAAVLAAALTLSTAAPAAAHTDTGEFSAVQAEPKPGGDGVYTIDVFLEFTNDGHGAEGAELTVTANGEAVAMAPGDRPGAYTGEVTLEPGTATIVATSPDPVAERTFTVEVPEQTATTAAPTTTEPPSPTSTEPEEDDGGSGRGILWIALLLAGVGIGIGLVAWWRSRRSGATTTP